MTNPPSPPIPSPSTRPSTNAASDSPNPDNAGRARLFGGIALLLLCAAAVVGVFLVVRSGGTSQTSPGQQEASAETADAILNTFLTLQRQTRLIEAEAVLKKGVEKYPDEQRKYPIVALGSGAHVHGGRRVAYLWDDDDSRNLYLYWIGGDWDDHCRFLAVRK